MLPRPRALLCLLGAVAAGVVIVRHGRIARGRTVPGGILIGDAAVYDALTHRLLFGSLFGPIAADVAALAHDDARILEVGCGPGHLSIRLARGYGLDVTGLDLDQAMIERARINARRADHGDHPQPSFVVGDAASLPFPDGTFDLVVSTLSMHHWADPAAALIEIGRVLRPDGRALIWDFRPGVVPFHAHLPDPLERAQRPPLGVVSATPWRWPWRFHVVDRIELARVDGVAGQSAM